MKLFNFLKPKIKSDQPVDDDKDIPPPNNGRFVMIYLPLKYAAMGWGHARIGWHDAHCGYYLRGPETPRLPSSLRWRELTEGEVKSAVPPLTWPQSKEPRAK